MNPTFFSSPAEFRKWLKQNYATASELWLGYYKKDSGRSGIMWPESVDEALCFGWIDGIRKSVDGISYKIRFTPRRSTSTWSAINVARVATLTTQGRMQSAGLQAFAARRDIKSCIYSYEQRRAQLEQPYENVLRKNKAGWSFFKAQSPSYRKQIAWWIISAKKEGTRQKRLQRLIEHSEHGKRL